MKPAAFEYFAPKSVEEAILLLAADDQACPLAGGQSLAPMMNLRLARPSALIDLNRIVDLAGVTEREDRLLIGAMTRQAELLRNPLVTRRAPLVAQALALVGHPATRARGTMGGSLSNADPAAELPVVMLALDAEFILRGPSGERRIKVEDFLIGMFETAIGPGELLIAIDIPSARSDDVSVFLEISRRHGDFAVVSVAANLSLADGLICTSARLALGGTAPAPLRCKTAEAVLVGQELSDRVISDCVDAIDPATIEMESHGASKAYRLQATRVLTRRALQAARLRSGAAA